MTLENRKELVRCVRNHAILDTIRSELGKLEFTYQGDCDRVETVASITNALISKTMADSDRIPFVNGGQ